jgi:hypothetical protein
MRIGEIPVARHDDRLSIARHDAPRIGRSAHPDGCRRPIPDGHAPYVPGKRRGPPRVAKSSFRSLHRECVERDRRRAPALGGRGCAIGGRAVPRPAGVYRAPHPRASHRLAGRRAAPHRCLVRRPHTRVGTTPGGRSGSSRPVAASRDGCCAAASRRSPASEGRIAQLAADGLSNRRSHRGSLSPEQSRGRVRRPDVTRRRELATALGGRVLITGCLPDASGPSGWQPRPT